MDEQTRGSKVKLKEGGSETVLLCVKLLGKTLTVFSILWPPNANSRLIGKAPDARKD